MDRLTRMRVENARQDHPELEEIETRHRALDNQVRQLHKRGNLLNAEEDRALNALKKEKLQTKDRLNRLLADAGV